jgi:hypothetical protein
MFSTNSVQQQSTGVKFGVNTVTLNAEIRSPKKNPESTDPKCLIISIADTYIQKIIWNPKQEGNPQGRACPYSFEFNGVKGTKGEVMTAQVSNALEMQTYIREVTNILRAACGQDAVAEGSTLDEFISNVVSQVNGKQVDVKLVYGALNPTKDKYYLEFAKKGYIAAPKSSTLSLTQEEITHGESAKAHNTGSNAQVSTPVASDELPF